MAKLLIISFDALGDSAFDRAAALPNTGSFLKESVLVRDVRSVFLTNTYPVHVSVVTGLPPGKHGLTSNVPVMPVRYPLWNYRASLIRAKTLPQAVAERGGKTAAVLWPVTGGAKSIRWNLPEIMPQPGDNQILLNMKHGSVLTQFRLWRKYGRLLSGIKQPNLDRFSAACMSDLLRRNRPDLALVHLTAYDSLCHFFGPGTEEAHAALKVLDAALSSLLNAAGPEYDVILFSDHGQFPLSHEILPNDMLLEMGLLNKDDGGSYILQEEGCFFECCGGAAFFHGGSLGLEKIDVIRRELQGSPGFNRFLTPEELTEAGRERSAFGCCAAEGFSYEVYPEGHKGQHGYPADYPNYGVFYAVRSAGARKGQVIHGGSLLDIAPIALKLLGEGLPASRGPVIPGLPPARGDIFL
ncbi:MAG: ectonucleotide pyrophosphatase/phosphodiesterase [Spirochaetaceae bacterium]|jgi:hypothetical protein|nr:ectonucleotide pyrophosphatase/phosphodiesterase [Spirochaetaceae bacterium]